MALARNKTDTAAVDFSSFQTLYKTEMLILKDKCEGSELSAGESFQGSRPIYKVYKSTVVPIFIEELSVDSYSNASGCKDTLSMVDVDRMESMDSQLTAVTVWSLWALC